MGASGWRPTRSRTHRHGTGRTAAGNPGHADPTAGRARWHGGTHGHRARWARGTHKHGAPTGTHGHGARMAMGSSGHGAPTGMERPWAWGTYKHGAPMNTAAAHRQRAPTGTGHSQARGTHGHGAPMHTHVLPQTPSTRRDTHRHKHTGTEPRAHACSAHALTRRRVQMCTAVMHTSVQGHARMHTRTLARPETGGTGKAPADPNPSTFCSSPELLAAG